MVRLSERDYEAVLAIVAEASTGTSDEPLPPGALLGIRRLTPAADTVRYLEGAPWNGVTRKVWIAGDSPPWSEPELHLLDELRFQIPLGPLPTIVGHAVRITDVMTLAAYRRTDLYCELGRRHGVEYPMDVWMSARDGLARGLTFDARRRDFTDRERDILEVLAHHLARVLGRLDAHLPHPAAELHLTPRQAEILTLVAQGCTNASIAAILSVSPHTVRTHLENAYASLGVHNRAASIARVYAERGAPDAPEAVSHAQSASRA